MKTPKIEIFTKPGCPYCVRAVALLLEKGVPFTEINVGDDPIQRAALIEKSNGSRTVPQIFINDQHVGGCDDLYALDRAGKLDPLLNLVA